MIRALLAAAVALLLAAPAEAATTLLPPGKMCLSDQNGTPLTGGKVWFYVPASTTPKTTWKDPNQLIANTNPVVLDSAGCAVVYGEGVYRQIVKDALGNPVWDQLTADTSGSGQSIAAFLNPGGRLTLASGQPILTGIGVSNATVVYYTPYNGNNVEVYNGSVLVPYTFAELNQVLDSNPAHSGYHLANKNFDEYIIADRTVAPATLRLCTGPAWSTDTVRGGAADITYTTYGYIANFNTITCRFGSGTNDILSIGPWQGTYVGTIRTTANGQTTMTMNPPAASGGNPPILFVFNEYNRVLMQANNYDNGGVYSYNLGTVRYARASANNVIKYISGDISDAIVVVYSQEMVTSATVGSQGAFCIGVDTVACTNSLAFFNTASPSGVGQVAILQATLTQPSILGFHTFNALEYVLAGGPVSFDPGFTPSLSCIIRM